MSGELVELSAADLTLLRFIVDESPSTIDHWNRWAESTDIDEHTSAAYLMMPAAYPKLAELDVDHQWMPRLRGVYRKAWVNEKLAASPVADAMEALEGAGIDYLPPLELAVRAVTTRPLLPRRNENRIVVRWDAVGEALSVLAAAGWAIPRRSMRGRSPRHRFTRVDDALQSPDGRWIRVADHVVPGRIGRSITDRIWAAARRVDGHRWAPGPGDLAFAVAAADRALGVRSLRCVLRLCALAHADRGELHVTVAPDPWRNLDLFVLDRIAWYRELGGGPVQRIEVDDYRPSERSSAERLQHGRDLYARWGGLAGIPLRLVEGSMLAPPNLGSLRARMCTSDSPDSEGGGTVGQAASDAT